jgi:hypothetical protein
MKQPTEDDFTVVEVLESGVTVCLNPRRVFYNFYRLADPKDIKRFGPVSPEPDGVRHADPLATPVTTDQMKFKGWHIRWPQRQRRRRSRQLPRCGELTYIKF